MLNPFPGLLVSYFFAPTIPRVAAGLLFAYIAYAHWTRRDALARVKFPLVGAGEWVVYVGVFFEALVAAGLIFGYLTQIAAILGAIASLKFFVLRRSYPQWACIDRAASFLLFFMCLSLLFTGAGRLAFDIPL